MDELILRSVNALAASPFWATLGVVLSSRWLILCICLPIAVHLARQKNWIAMISIAVAMGSTDLVGARAIKPFVARERPCREISGLVLPVRCGVGRSFPSNHAAIAFAFLFTAAPIFRFGWAMFAPLAISVGASRVLLGVHYPSDVAGGAIFGSMIGGALWFGRRRWELARRSTPLVSTSPSGTNEPASPPQ